MMQPMLVRAAPWAWLTRTWADPQARRWVRRVVLWLLLGYVIRYIYFVNFYQATEAGRWGVSLGLLTHTIALYYFFGYYVFPRTLYERRFWPFWAWLLVWYVLVHVSNYGLFYLLRHEGPGHTPLREWQRFAGWGLWAGLPTSGAIFFNIFWSFTFASVMLTIRAVTDIIGLRTRIVRLEKDKLQLELDFLKAQVSPHFLFNTLNSAYARVFDIDEGAADLLLRLSELMRYNLYETDQPSVALAKELGYIENYLDLERNRLGDERVSITYTQTGQADAHQIAPLLLIAFVENAFKHGVRGTSKQAFVRVQADVAGGQLTFTVENSVFAKRPLASPDPVKRAGGIGLVNVRRRLQTLYPNRHHVAVTPGEAMYRVIIRIQL